MGDVKDRKNVEEDGRRGYHRKRKVVENRHGERRYGVKAHKDAIHRIEEVVREGLGAGQLFSWTRWTARLEIRRLLGVGELNAFWYKVLIE